MVKYRLLGTKPSRAFTLVEMLVSLAVLSLILLAVAQMVSDTGKLWKNTTSKINSFQGARAGFQLLASELQQATVNTYLDYFDATGKTLGQFTSTYESSGAPGSSVTRNAYTPVAYGRQSELHFISGQGSALLSTGGLTTETHAVFFQCPQGVNLNLTPSQSLSGLNKLLNAEGFFVEYCSQNTSANSPPTILASPDSYRYRLMQFVQPTENNAVYNYPTLDTVPNNWFVLPITTPATHATTVRIVADNVIALILWPKLTDSSVDTLTGTTYAYDSRFGGNPWVPGTTIDPTTGNKQQPVEMNQMPPLIRVAMVAIDEPSAAILQPSTTTTEPVAINSALNASTNPEHPGVRLFTVPQNMDSDINYLQTELSEIKPKIRFQVYTTTVSVRSAKFSTN